MASLATFGNDLYTGRRQFNLIGQRKRFYGFVVVLLIVAAIGLFGRGLNFGLEFTGGSEVKVPGVNNTQNYESRVKSAIQTAGGDTGDLVITKLGDNTIDVKSKNLGKDAQTTDNVKDALAKEFKVKNSNVTSTYVGPSWGKTVTKKAITALITFLVFVAIVLALYFRTWTMSVAAIIALIHDLFFTVGIYALTGLEVTPATMIGFLTILGYSIYDTVVVFDKVRENVSEAFATGRRSYDQAANYAVNQTLVRSINTSVVALLPIASIMVVGVFWIGPSTLLDIAVALFIGVSVGTFSSIFIATPVLTDLRRRETSVRELDRRAKAYRTRMGTADDASEGASASGVTSVESKPREASERRREIHPAARQEDDE